MAVKIFVDRYDGFYMMVALDGDRQVGCLTLNTTSSATDPADPTCRLATVKWIGVSPKLRGTGIATRMYEQAARLAARLGRTLASDSVFLKAGKGFWQKQERLGRARKIGKRWILTCAPRTRLKNPTSVRKLSSGVVVVNASPAERESVIAALVRAGFTVTNYQAGTLAVGGASSVGQVQHVLKFGSPCGQNPMPDEVFAGPPQPEVSLERDFFFTYSPPPSNIPWWAGGAVSANPALG